MVSWKIFNGSENEWNERLRTLSFFSIYQSYQWGEIKKNDGWYVARFISLEPQLSMTQIFFKRLPLKGAFFWCPGGILGVAHVIDLNQFKSDLGFKYFYFRCSFHQPNLDVAYLESLGWKKPSYCLNSNQTMSIKVDRTDEEILKEMSSNWRHNLKRFEKKQISIARWSPPDPAILFEYYKKFESFKGLSQQHTFESIKGVMEKFNNQLVILHALDSEGKLLALRGYVYIGDRALDWFAISTELGRACYASHGVIWAMLKDARDRGVSEYDLSGVDPINNAGVYNFKKGTGALLVEYPGEFEISNFPFVSFGMNMLMKRRFAV